jgi:hypothetical protein
VILVQKTTTDNGYQQWDICNGSEMVSDGSLELLQMTFYVVVGHTCPTLDRKLGQRKCGGKIKKLNPKERIISIILI